MNESIKNMIERRSVRGYKLDMIPNEDLELILEAGTYAATGHGNAVTGYCCRYGQRHPRPAFQNECAMSWEPIPIRFTEHRLYWLY